MQRLPAEGLSHMWQGGPASPLCLGRAVPPGAGPETRIQQQVVYLGSSRYTVRVGELRQGRVAASKHIISPAPLRAAGAYSYRETLGNGVKRMP